MENQSCDQSICLNYSFNNLTIDHLITNFCGIIGMFLINSQFSSIKYIILCMIFMIISKTIYMHFYKKNKCFSDHQIPPIVEGGIPFLGHILSMRKNTPKFLAACQNKYGDIFELTVLRQRYIIVGDRSLLDDIFGAKEDRLSLATVFDETFLSSALTDTPEEFHHSIQMIKKRAPRIYQDMQRNPNSFASKQFEELMREFLERLRTEVGAKPVNVMNECRRFTALIGLVCVLEIPRHIINNEIIDVIGEILTLTEQSVLSARLFPKIILRALYGWNLKNLRKRLYKLLGPHIHLLPVLEVENGTVRQRINACLVHVFALMDNTSLLLGNTLYEMAKTTDWWNEVRDEVNTNPSSGFLSLPKLNAVVFEGARITANFVTTARITVSNNTIIKRDNCGKSVLIPHRGTLLVIPGGLLQVYGPLVNKTHNEPHIFKPERFLGDFPEPTTGTNFPTWGSRVHACPGRSLALAVVRSTIGKIIMNFNMTLQMPIPSPRPITSVAFSRRDYYAFFT